jgi:hypothetical protein
MFPWLTNQLLRTGVLLPLLLGKATREPTESWQVLQKDLATHNL